MDATLFLVSFTAVVCYAAGFVAGRAFGRKSK